MYKNFYIYSHKQGFEASVVSLFTDTTDSLTTVMLVYVYDGR